ncbi:hypothetical protein MMC22_009406 [Lobaria immixta]|nr:hypothetical protein [Lobaria immixta]
MQDFPGLPPFPTDVESINLPILDWGKLLARDESESEGLFAACKDHGMFQLDLKNTETGPLLLEDVDRLFSFTKDLFEVSLEEKEKYKMSAKTMFGYKGVGKLVIDDEGTPDRNEFFSISKDDIFGNAAASATLDIITQNKVLLKSYMTRSHTIVTTILDRLDAKLQLPAGTLSSLHRLDLTDRNQTRLLHYAPQPDKDRRASSVTHTDLGSVTVLFNRLGGLQVRSVGKTESDWSYVRPIPGHAIINLGDVMTKFTHGLLLAREHRVTFAPGLQAERPRYSLAYLARPNSDVLVKRLSGGHVIPPLDDGEKEEDISSADWITKRLAGHKYGAPKPQEPHVNGSANSS